VKLNKTPSSGLLKLAARGPYPASHAPFFGPHHASFMLALGRTNLCIWLCHSRQIYAYGYVELLFYL